MTFSALQDRDFLGRQDQLADLVKRLVPARNGIERSVVLTGPPGIGKTELLKQLYGYLFWKQDHVAPFYIVVNSALLSAAAFSNAYLTQFLCQRLAFETRDQSLAYREELSIDGLFALADERDAAWMLDILDQYKRVMGNPLNALRMALSAPHRSALSSGRPVVVLIDEFHRLQGLHLDGTVDRRLVSLFETTLSFSNTPHIITGCATELLEMSFLSNLERIIIEPLSAEAAAARALFLLRAYDVEGTIPPSLLHRLRGNPFYLGCVIRMARAKNNPEERDFWNAYIREVLDGSIAASWTSALKRHFPDLDLRRIALAVTRKIHLAAGALACSRIATSFAIPEGRAEAVMHTLYLAGIIRGEFGMFRAPEDQVLKDVIECLYMREFQAKSSRELERDLREKLSDGRHNGVRFEMTLPSAPEAELVAAQCLEQIGKNFQISQEAIGQLQIALIEACINAKEHGDVASDGITVSMAVEGNRLEVTIESAGQEFIVQESGEPFSGREAPKTPGRGWGLPLMKRFADDVRFEKTSRGIRTILIKNLAATADPPKGKSADEQ